MAHRVTSASIYDVNNDGVIDADEYKVFRYDIDGDGQLDENERRTMAGDDTQFTFRATGDKRKGKEVFLGGGLAVDMMFLQGSDDVPAHFNCPITDRPMTEPVIASGTACLRLPR